MITAHLPAGYVLSRTTDVTGGRSLAAALVGSVFPDFDMLFFYFVDNRAFHHHEYWVHIPTFWLAVCAFTMPFVWRTAWRVPGLVFFAAILLHIVLDAIAGGIVWLAPFDTTLYTFITVPPAYSHWIISFVMHWTFLLEVAIWLTAAWLFVGKGQR